MVYDPNENIHIEFLCPHCEGTHIINYGEFKGIFEIHHFYCTHSNCNKHFWFKFDQDMKIYYLKEEDLK